MHKKFSQYRFDILVLVFLLLAGVSYALLTRSLYIGKGLFVGIVFFVPPSVYLTLRKKKNLYKLLISTLIFGTIFGLAFDFISEYTLAWTVTNQVFVNKIFGVNTIDSVLGFMMMTYLTIVFYEHFIDHELDPKIHKRILIILIPSIIGLFVLFAIYFNKPHLLNINYPYLVLGVFAILPVIYLVVRRPRFLKKLTIATIYFFFLYLIFELIAVSNGYWVFNGNNYIGWVELFNIKFPFEELFFWMLFYTAALISYYEIFIDDRK